MEKKHSATLLWQSDTLKNNLGGFKSGSCSLETKISGTARWKSYLLHINPTSCMHARIPECPSCSQDIFIHQRQMTAYRFAIFPDKMKLLSSSFALDSLRQLNCILKWKDLFYVTQTFIMDYGWACTEPGVCLDVRVTSHASWTSRQNG